MLAVAAVDDPAGEHGQQGQQVVAAPLRNSSRSVGVQLTASTSQLSVCRYFSVRARQRPGVGDQRLDDRVPVAAERAGVEHVEREALPAFAATSRRGQWSPMV